MYSSAIYNRVAYISLHNLTLIVTGEGVLLEVGAIMGEVVLLEIGVSTLATEDGVSGRCACVAESVMSTLTAACELGSFWNWKTNFH